jgi:hypothetical protein
MSGTCVLSVTAGHACRACASARALAHSEPHTCGNSPANRCCAASSFCSRSCRGRRGSLPRRGLAAWWASQAAAAHAATSLAACRRSACRLCCAGVTTHGGAVEVRAIMEVWAVVEGCCHTAVVKAWLGMCTYELYCRRLTFTSHALQKVLNDGQVPRHTAYAILPPPRSTQSQGEGRPCVRVHATATN